ncbi:MAG: glucose 1-dehydrogenase [Nitrospirales bacterium]|nr:glucose 1-dehydrogenase [Nitrospira sp.]MDR4488221.1 glucose 1-dehydrogenase [Nitrospirales bacterium]
MSARGKVAIITGASSGIGRGIAERLSQEGAAVVINYAKSAEKAKAIVASIEAKGGRALAIQADVSQVTDIQRLFQATLKQFDRIDIVIANAGMFNQKPLMDTTEAEYDAMLALNAKGAFFTLQEAGRHIQDGGRIIFISTGATAMSFPGAAAYKGSKAAGEQFSQTLAKELGPRQITVNTVSPGFTETEMLPKDEAFRQAGIDMSPLGRLGQPKDIADIVSFLVSEEGGWITGNTIQAGGGII